MIGSVAMPSVRLQLAGVPTSQRIVPESSEGPNPVRPRQAFGGDRGRRSVTADREADSVRRRERVMLENDLR